MNGSNNERGHYFIQYSIRDRFEAISRLRSGVPVIGEIGERAGDGGDDKLKAVRPWGALSEDKQTCEAESGADVVLRSSGTAGGPEGDTVESGESANERVDTVTLICLASFETLRSGAVIVSQNWKRGG